MKEAVLYDLGVSVGPDKTEMVHAGWVIRGDFDDGLFAKVREDVGKVPGAVHHPGASASRVFSLPRLRDRGQQWAWTASLSSSLGSLKVGSPPMVIPSKGAGAMS